jgi:hypothetical protein
LRAQDEPVAPKSAEILPAATLVLLCGNVTGIYGVVRQSIPGSGA